MANLGIGLPLYNDETIIAKSIESVLNQTYQNFHLHIFDNNSSDCSLKIAEEYVKKDNRVFIHKNSANIGLARNFNKALSLNDYQYVSLKSSNDLIYPLYYEKCIEFLEKNNDFVLCYSDGTNTNEKGRVLLSYDQEDVYERLKNIINTYTYGNVIYGVYRARALDKTLLFDNIQGNDHVFAFNLAMIGKLKKIESVLYQREVPIGRTAELYRSLCHSSINQPKNNNFPNCKCLEMFLGYINVCHKGFLNGLDKDKLIKLVVKTFSGKCEKEYQQLKCWLDENKDDITDFDYFEYLLFFNRVSYYLGKVRG